jgi:HSP20 family molecular chaperone IbpA
MTGPGQQYDPMQMNAKLREMLRKGDTSELPGFIQELLMNSIANPLTQSILSPLAQSLAAPLAQFFSNSMASGFKNETIIQEDAPQAAVNRLDPQLFEILGFVVIRTYIPEDVDEKEVKILFAPSHVTIKGDPSGSEHIIPLPPGTKKEGAMAAFKDRILEVRIPRDNEAVSAEEISVEFL